MFRIFIAVLWSTLIFSSVFAQETAKLNFIAVDKMSNAVVDLKKEEIVFLIDGKPQGIMSFEKEETPLIYALAVDTSGSMRTILDDIVNSALTIVDQSRKGDEGLAFSFISTDKFRGMGNFSSDKNVLMRTINNFYIEGGQTALIDALYTAVKKASEHKREEGERYRRVVFAISDGEDRMSSNTEKTLSELIQKENVQIFFVGLGNELSRDGGYMTKSSKGKAKDFIERIVAASGGAAIFPKRIEDSSAAAAQLTSLSQSQYALSYTPVIDGKGKSQKIEIKLAKDSSRKNVKFYFRGGN